MKSWFLLSLTLLAACANHSAWVNDVVEARAGQQLAPVRHHSLPGAELDDAYKVQRAVVTQLIPAAGVAGYKGGLTAADSWLRFKLDEPVVGVLPAQGVVDQALSLSAFNRLVIELELAFVFDHQVSEAITDVATLKQKVAAIHPAIEMPDLAYEDMRLFTGLDLIANNVSAHRYKLGAAFPQTLNPDSIVTELRCDGEVLSQGRAEEVRGGQWQTLLWLVNKLISVGYTIEPGQFVLTGSLGKVVNAIEGQCVAGFADKKISFDLQP